MCLKSVILSLIIIGFAAINYFAEGLQCYVCEDCNENEDFKELQICGEILIGLTTMRTTTTPLLEVMEEGSSSTKSTIESTSQRPISTDDYFYEDNNETNKQNSNQKTTKKPITTKATTATQNQMSSTKFTTQTPAIEVTKALTESSATITLVEGTTMIMKPTTTEEALVTNNTQEESIKLTLTTTTTTAKPILIPDYDDYLEYEDFSSRSDKSLLKINEPVCYMIKYQVNNTVLTNRGCTTFINASKYLTCQSLYNGAPMESCRICSSNGCNKFIEDKSDYEVDYENSMACTLQLYGICMLFLGILLNHFIF